MAACAPFRISRTFFAMILSPKKGHCTKGRFMMKRPFVQTSGIEPSYDTVQTGSHGDSLQLDREARLGGRFINDLLQRQDGVEDLCGVVSGVSSAVRSLAGSRRQLLQRVLDGSIGGVLRE